MADTIDTLQIEISATANDALKKIDALVSSLNELKESVEGTAGLDTLAQRIKALADATNSLTSSGVKNLSDMATALQSLSSVEKPKSTSTIAKNIESLGKASNSLSYDGAQALMAYTKLLQYLSAIPKASGLSSTVNALSKLKSVDFSGISEENMRALASALNVLGDVKTSEGLKTTLTQLNRIPKIMEALDSAGLEKFANQMKEVASAMKPLADEMDKIARGFDKFPSKITSTISAIDKMSTTAKRSSSVFGTFNSSFAKFGLFYITFDRVVDVLSNAVNESNNYIETLNLFNVSMKEFYEEALEYANLVSDKLKIDPSEWMRAQGTFMSMAAGFGVSRDKAYQLSESLTELSYDISSLYNESVESSILRLQSALAGEIEPIRRLGISISEASLQEYALSKGIDKAVNSMTEQEKALLRSTVLIERAASIGAVGDFVKTIESPANALRILNQQIVQLSRAIGNLIIPILIKVIPYVRAFVEVLTEVVQTLALLVGWELPKWDSNDWSSNITGGFEGIGTSADEAADSVKKLKDYTLGIDELNIISPDTETDNAGVGAGGVGGSSWFEDLEIPDLWDKDFIKDIETQTEGLKAQMQDLLKIIGAIGAALLAWKLAKTIFNDLKLLKEMIASLASGISAIPSILSSIPAVLSGIFTIPNAIIAGIIATIAAMVARIAYLWQNSQAFRDGIQVILEALGGMFDWVTEHLTELQTVFSAFSFGILPNFIPDSLIEKVEGFFNKVSEFLDKMGLDFVDVFMLIAPNFQIFEWLTLAIRTLGVVSEGSLQVLIEKLTNVKDNIISFFTDKIPSAFEKTIKYFTDNIPKAVDQTVKWFQSLPEKIGYALGLVLGTFDKWKGQVLAWITTNVVQLIQTIVNFFIELPEKIYTALEEFKFTLKKWAIIAILWVGIEVPKIIDSITDWFKKLPGRLYDIGKSMIESLGNGIKAMWNWLSEIVSGIIDTVVGMFTGIGDAIGDFVSGANSGYEEGSGIGRSAYGIKGFASGGFPEHGQLFFANESGPELVGRIGNRTAVANGDQIVSGIQVGVETANASMVSVLYQLLDVAERIAEKDNTVQIGDEVIGASANRYNSNKGYNLGIST